MRAFEGLFYQCDTKKLLGHEIDRPGAKNKVNALSSNDDIMILFDFIWQNCTKP